MKNQLLASLATGAALVYCTLTGVCQSIPPEIPIRTVQDRLIIVSVRLNGQGPFDFVLDTGTDLTIMDSALADKLGLVRSGQMQQISIAGERMVDKTMLHTATLGSVQAENLPVLVEDLVAIRKAVPGIQGILSQDFLTRFNYLLDYSKHVLRIESGSEFRDTLIGLKVPFRTSHDIGRDNMVVTIVAQVSNHTTLRLVLDSGAMSIVLAPEAWTRLKVPVQEDRWERTPTGDVEVHTGLIHQVTVGTERLYEVLAASSAVSASQAGDGLLPTSLFHSFYVNNRENFVVFNPRSGVSSHHR